MIRPPLEVADIVRTYGTAFVERHRRWLTLLHLKVLRAIAACRTAALGGHLQQCDGCGQQASSGWRSAPPNYCRSRTTMWCSPCPTSWLPWPCRIRLCFTACFFGPRLRLSSRSPPIPNTWALRSDFSLFCTPGVRLSCIIPMCIASCREEGSRPIIVSGLPADASSFCRSKYSVLCFAESFSLLYNEPFENTSSPSPASWLLSNPHPRSPLCCARLPSAT